jgi:predicted RNA-binding Zn ribbon-like protein
VPRQFFWIGNHPGLDFLNTAAVDAEGEPVDLLDGPHALCDWAEQAALVGTDVVVACRSLPAAAAEALLGWARALRQRARAVLDPAAATEGAAAGLAEVVGVVPVRLTYRPGDGGGPTAVVEAVAPADALRLALARAVLEAASLDAGRIRRCEGARCVLLYYDTSKNRSRRWCDMATCGNRAKAAAHYRRAKHRST